MSVTQETPIASSLANGVTTVFPHSFTVLSAGDLVVQGVLSGVRTVYTLGVHYTVSGLGSPSGSVTFLTAPANGTVVTRYRDSAIERLTDYQDNGDLLASTLNADFDRPLLLLQEIFNGGKGAPTSIRVPSGELVDALPAAAARANRLLAFNSVGQPIAMVGVDAGSAAALQLDLASTATSKGTDLIGHPPSYFGGVGRLLSLKLADWVSFGDFEAVGDGTADDTVAVQKGIDAMGLLGGGYIIGVPGKTYKISAALILKTRVRIDLQTSMILQTANNTPVFKAPSTGPIQSWGICNGRLRYNTQQTSTQTSAVGVQLADGQLSYDWYLMDLRIERACDGVMCPPTTGSFAFVGRVVNVIADTCARWALNIDCDSINGANTNLQFVNCWALQPSGGAISTSRGFRFNALSMGCFESLFSDYIQGPLMEATNCDGRWGMLTMEASTIVANNTQIALVQFSECSGSIETLKLVSNTLTASGTGEIYMVRATTAGVQTMAIGNLVTQTNTYSGGGAIYELNPTAGMTFSVRRAKLDRVENLVDPDLHAPRITEWNGRERIGKGTTAQRPTLPASARGVRYLDTTLAAAGKPIQWTGTAWVDGLGASV